MEIIPTGITGLDAMLGGGFPSARVVLIHGGPGSGKTIFSLQFLMKGIENGERGIYVTLEEPMNLIKANMLPFDWDLEDLEKKDLLKTIDASQLTFPIFSDTRFSPRSSPSATLANQIEQAVKNFKAKRMALDPLTSVVIHQRFPTDKRIEIGHLFKSLRKMKCTSIVTSEYSSTRGEFYLEEYLADGVIVLHKTLKDFRMIKTVRIEKMRGTKHDENPRKYEMGDKGVIVYHTEPVIT